jgi:predicted phosphodiesterase
VLLALLGAGFTVTFFGTQTYHWRAFDIQVRMYPSMKGTTELRFIPLGEVHAATHRIPIALQISLMNIDFDGAKRLMVKPPSPHLLEEDFTKTARHDLIMFALHQVLVGAIGGLLAPLLLKTKTHFWVISAFIGGGFVALTLFLTVRSFKPAAFEAPTYTGALQQAEWVITLVKDGFNKVEALSQKLRNVASNLSRLYERINSVPQLEAGQNTITVLHVSDIHNNPGSVAFVRELVQGTKVDLVIDTGDLTDFGLPLETEITKEIAQINVPYVFVAGNHDSQAIVQAVKKNKNAIVLDGKSVLVAGLNILGAPDPSSERVSGSEVTTSPAALSLAANNLAAAYLASTPPPDLVCVHDPLQSVPLIGKAPLILCGHEHRIYVDVKDGTVICNAGTTGAAGGRYFDHKNGVAMTAAILCFSRTPRPRLLFIDQIVLQGSLGEYSINRRTFSGASADVPVNDVPAAGPIVPVSPSQ